MLNKVAFFIVRLICRILLSSFFSDVVVVGANNVPKWGPVIVLGNHPNYGVDGLLMGTMCPRMLHWWGKDMMFKNKIIGKMLRALGGVSVSRDRNVSNDALFKDSFKVLEEGGAIGLFPEGHSYTESKMLPVRTGAARLALGAAHQSTQKHFFVNVVPMGIVYVRKNAFRSQVLVQFGQPIYIDRDALATYDYAKDEKAAVVKLTSEVEDRLHSLTINADDFDTLQALHTARRLYKPSVGMTLHDYVSTTKRFVDGYPAASTDPDVNRLKGQLIEYQGILRGMNLTDSDVATCQDSPEEIKRLIGRSLVRLFVLIPLALPGIILHLPLYLPGLLIDMLVPRTEAKATVKISLILYCLPPVYTAAAYYGSAELSLGWLGFFLLLFVAFPLAAILHVNSLDSGSSVLRSATGALRCLRFNDEVKKLKAIREDLTKQVRVAVERYKPASKDSASTDESVGKNVRRRESFAEVFM
eukprot:Opistho-2@28390